MRGGEQVIGGGCVRYLGVGRGEEGGREESG